jgi:hypothetical protein
MQNMESKELEVVFVIEPDLPLAKEMGRLVKANFGKVIQWYTMDIEELGFIAKHRILPAQTIIVLHNSKVVCRLVNSVPTTTKFKRILKRIYEEINK